MPADNSDTIGEDLLSRDELCRLILNHAPIGISVLTPDFRYQFVNDVFYERILPAGTDSVIGRRCYDLLGQHRDDLSRKGDERVCADCPAAEALASGEPRAAMRRIRDDLVVRNLSVPLFDADGEAVGVIEIIEDVSDRVADPLTGIHNYRYFQEVGIREFAHARRYDVPLSLLALDIDNFKSVNDRFGHVQGDTTLKAVADVLRDSVRASDHLCRVGGDEFAVLAPHTGAEEAAKLAGRLCEAVDGAFGRIGLSLSAGCATYPDDTSEPERHLREIADRRLYEHKARRR